MKATTEFEKAIAAYLESVKNTCPNLSEALIREGKTIKSCHRKTDNYGFKKSNSKKNNKI